MVRGCGGIVRLKVTLVFCFGPNWTLSLNLELDQAEQYEKTLYSAPIDMSGNFPAMCLQIHLQTSPLIPQKLYQKFQEDRTAFEKSHFVQPKIA